MRQNAASGGYTKPTKNDDFEMSDSIFAIVLEAGKSPHRAKRA
jgi:hypothetical protein